MARSRYHIFHGDSSPYFITETTVNWLPLFSNPAIAKIILDSLRYLQECRELDIYAYVLMENHMHAVVASADLTKDLANFKSFTARQCINFYTDGKLDWVLNQLRENKLPGRKDRDYQFWQEGHHPQVITSREMMLQKIEYIHANPVRRGYVDVPEQWRYSSARNYLGETGILEVIMEW
jgi:putative transposase